MSDVVLQVTGLRGSYDRVPALWDIDFTVHAAEIVGVIGANGAGKTSLLKAIAGLEIKTSGSVLFEGREVVGAPCHQHVRMGISLVAQSRELFPNLTVQENLQVASYHYRKQKQRVAANIEHVFEMFPIVAMRRREHVGNLSGGEQQMVAVGRAMMAEPRLLLMDEPSTGLSPSLVELVMSKVSALRDAGVAMVIVEQAIDVLVRTVDRVVLMTNGRVVDAWKTEDLDIASVRAAYMGLT